MLDLSHPHSQHVLHASGIFDSFMGATRKFSNSCPEIRAEAKATALALLDKLREFAAIEFKEQEPYIVRWLEVGRALVEEFDPDGVRYVQKGCCSNCGALMLPAPYPEYQADPLCLDCLGKFTPVVRAMDSLDGFGLGCI